MIDIDGVEHDGQGNPLAIIETKFGLKSEIDLNDLQFDVLCNLAREEIPVFCLVYYPMDSDGLLVDAGQESRMSRIQFIAIGVNKLGREYLPKMQRLTERQWVALVAKLHNHPMNDKNKYYDTWTDDVVIPHFINRPI